MALTAKQTSYDPRGITSTQALFCQFIALGRTRREAERLIGTGPKVTAKWYNQVNFLKAVKEAQYNSIEFLRNLRLEIGALTVEIIFKVYREATDLRLLLEVAKLGAKISGIEAPSRHAHAHEHEHTIHMTPSRARAIMNRAELETAEKWLKEGKINEAQFEVIKQEKESAEIVDIRRPELSGGEGVSEETESSDEPGEFQSAAEPEETDRGV